MFNLRNLDEEVGKTLRKIIGRNLIILTKIKVEKIKEGVRKIYKISTKKTPIGKEKADFSLREILEHLKNLDTVKSLDLRVTLSETERKELDGVLKRIAEIIK